MRAIQTEFIQKYWHIIKKDIRGTWRQKDFAQFLPLKKRIRNWVKS